MDMQTLHTPKIALVLGGLALAAAACGTGSGTSTSASPSGASATSGSSGAVVSTESVDGTAGVVSADGHTLYDAKGESPRHILCVDTCTSIWKPVLASRQQAQRASSALDQTFTVAARPDGGTQLVYAGHPLYMFAPEGPHQLQGNGAADEFGGTHFDWSAATTAAAPIGASSPSGPRMGSKPTSGGGGYGY